MIYVKKIKTNHNVCKIYKDIYNHDIIKTANSFI